MNFDNESLAYLSERKNELILSHIDYINQHPEIREVLNDFISGVLLHKPVSSEPLLCNFTLGRTTFLSTLRNTSTLSTPSHFNTNH